MASGWTLKDNYLQNAEKLHRKYIIEKIRTSLTNAATKCGVTERISSCSGQ